MDVNVKKAKINLKQNKVFVDLNIKNLNIRFVAPIEEEMQEEEETIMEDLNVNIDDNGYLTNNEIKEESNS